ncbi:MAG: EamA family transporter [Rhodospirillaceae bacterium]|jgi:drug/metabolite transporter (DMT)-like permease|nr:EamA family transporter [Rhodospirillaceae bacterium]MBT5359734.1 EamA family transporter [Rhodospirillaceae bacterium]MBT5944407.1 EamA family transporter [Rhodospirillaceae bacterium]MBT6403507.1 EamA family transporter [Rhodospirillaceae bacterium]MBT7361531.1 EamA family transporter [Rhodospirillaceae bacterium]
MTTIVALAVVLSALMHAGWNALVKGGDDGWLTGALISGFAAAGALIVAIAFVPWPASHHWPWLIGSGALHAGYFILLMSAYTHGDLGKVYAIARGTAPLVIVALAGPLVGDTPGWQEIAAILVLVAGVVTLTFEPGKFATADLKAVLLALLTGSMIAAYSLFDAIGIRTIGPEIEYAAITYGSWLMIFAAIPIFAVVFTIRRGRIITHMRANALKGAAGGVIAVGSYMLILFAFANASVASVAALRETGVVFAALIGTFILGERLGRRRIPAAILVAVGAGAIKFAA